MTGDVGNTLSKEERIHGQKLIDKLFNGSGARSMTVFPLRAVFLDVEAEEGEPRARILVSVSKRHFKHAVDRNRVKRQIRESYRKHKHLLLETLESKPIASLLVAFIWMDDKLHDSSYVEQRMEKLLQKLAERS